jgi:hypothetical protein
MRRKIVIGFITLVIAHSSFAIDKHQANKTQPELDPFAPAVAAYASICSERQPENARYYQAAVDAVFKGHHEEYKQLSKDVEFQKKLRESRKMSKTKPKAELDSECNEYLSMGKEAAGGSKLQK